MIGTYYGTFYIFLTKNTLKIKKCYKSYSLVSTLYPRSFFLLLFDLYVLNFETNALNLKYCIVQVSFS